MDDRFGVATVGKKRGEIIVNYCYNCTCCLIINDLRTPGRWAVQSFVTFGVKPVRRLHKQGINTPPMRFRDGSGAARTFCGNSFRRGHGLGEWTIALVGCGQTRLPGRGGAWICSVAGADSWIVLRPAVEFLSKLSWWQLYLSRAKFRSPTLPELPGLPNLPQPSAKLRPARGI